MAAGRPRSATRPRPLRHDVALGLVLLALGCAAQPLAASEVSLHVVDIWQGSEFIGIVSRLGDGGYELSDGTWVAFADWYHTDWPEVKIELMTQFGEDFGLLWGFGSGERGEKYTIDPSLRLGVIAQAHPSPTSTLAFELRGTFWGALREEPCLADYGEIGGTQSVACRLAASILPPDETLAFLVDAPPTRLRVSLTYSARF